MSRITIAVAFGIAVLNGSLLQSQDSVETATDAKMAVTAKDLDGVLAHEINEDAAAVIRAKHKRLADDLRRMHAEFTSTAPQGNERDARQLEWLSRRMERESAFFLEVERELDGEELLAWQGAVRRARRIDCLQIMLTKPPNLDALVSACLQGDDVDRAQTLLREYDHAWESAILSRLPIYLDDRRRYMELLDDESAADRQRLLVQRFFAFEDAAQRLTNEYVGLVRNALSPEGGAKFVHCYYQQQRPHLFAPSPVALMVGRMRTLVALPENNRVVIEQIVGAFEVQYAEIAQRIMQAEDQRSRWSQTREEIEARRQREWFELHKDAGYHFYQTEVTDLHGQRYELVRETMARLRQLFTAEEMQALPLDVQALLLWGER